MRLLDFSLLLLALLGHAAICVGALNRAHAIGIPRILVKTLSLAAAIWCPLLPALLLWHAVATATSLAAWLDDARHATVLLSYAVVCWMIAVIVIGRWIRRTFITHKPAQLLANHTRRFDVARSLGFRPIGNAVGRIFDAIPGNQILTIHLQEKTLRVPRLDPALDGLSILHLSDLHFTGRIGKEYFQEVIRLAGETEPDMVALTGDFVDEAACIDWIPDTLGRLRAPHGVYFVLGNHDPRVRQTARLRKTLVDCGLIDLAGRWLQQTIRGRPVILAGNEMPWFEPAPDLSDCPLAVDGVRPLRVLLAHTPDLIGWARRHDIDLMLAGHNHGGQARIPGIGPVLCPSRYGVRYSSGVFFEQPTLLHVSRGVSAQTPLRWNCPPEATKLILRA